MCQQAVDFVGQRFGRLDILVNGAAGNFLAQAKEISPKGFATVMAIDTLGTFNMSRAAHELLAKKSSDDSIVINISATLHYGATYWQAHASAAKAAVDSLTRSLALEWGDDKIRVVGIAPGPIANTPGTTVRLENIR
jgi:peroxisomal 2,4-dienoyl-CoA reductase